MIRGPLTRRKLMREHRWTSEHAWAYFDSELSPRDRARVEDHAGLCPECRRALRELRWTLKGLMGLRPVQPEGVSDRVIDRLRRER